MAFVYFLYIQTMYKLCKMYTNVNRIIYAAADVCFLYTKPLYSLLFEYFYINNNAIFRLILHFCKISGPVVLYSKRFTDEFIL